MDLMYISLHRFAVFSFLVYSRSTEKNFPLTGYCLVKGINRIKKTFIPRFDSVRSTYVTLKIISVMNTHRFHHFL